MTEQEIERCLERFATCKVTDIMNFDYAGTLAYIERMKTEIAELRARLEKAVELPVKAKEQKQRARAEEAGHRAEVAERALRRYTRAIGCVKCPYAMSCDIFPPTPQNDYIECYDEVLRLAEKEIAEE